MKRRTTTTTIAGEKLLISLLCCLAVVVASSENNNGEGEFMWGYSNVLPEELLPLLTEEAKLFFDYEWAEPLGENHRRTRWISREQLENPRTTVELAIGMLSKIAQPQIPEDWGGCEWWVQVRKTSGTLSFHFDKDEALWDYKKQVIHPLIGSVFYLTDLGGPTLITDQKWSAQKPHAFPIQPNRAGYSFPERNKYLLFNGTLLHAILPATLSPNQLRVTLLVNYWKTQPSWPNVDVLDYEHVSRGLWGESIRETLNRYYRSTIEPKIKKILSPNEEKDQTIQPFTSEAENQIKIWHRSAKNGILVGEPKQVPAKDIQMSSLIDEGNSKTLRYSFQDFTFAIEIPETTFLSKGFALLHYDDESKEESAESSGALRYWRNSAQIKANSLRFSGDDEEFTQQNNE